MTRKDFELIADIIKGLPTLGMANSANFDPYAASEEDMNDCAKEIRRLIAVNFASRLSATNPRFDAERFLEACK